MILVLGTVLILSLVLSAQLAPVALADNPGSEANPLTMIFHMHGLVYGNSIGSIFIYNGADTNPPTYATPVTASVYCSSSALDFQQFLPQSAQTWFTGGNVWFGGISWITQPLAEDLAIKGNVSMTVWMSSFDPNVAVSGYVFGVSETDSSANIVGDPAYEYYYGNGDVLGSTPSLYRLTFNVDRTFTRGNIVAFFVGVGSTTKDWRYQVYFDSQTMNSFTELPVLTVPVPEFSQIGILASASVAVLSSYLFTRSRNRRSSSSDPHCANRPCAESR